MEDNVVRRLQFELERLNERCARVEREHQEAEDDRQAIARTIAILTRRPARASADLNVQPEDLVGMTQEQAVVHVAEQGNGVLRSGPTKNLLLRAGLIANPKNAASILYTLLQRSGRFEQVHRGEYRLRPQGVDALPDWLEDLPDDGPTLRELAGDDDAPTLREMTG
jgi:hypothetical protein